MSAVAPEVGARIEWLAPLHEPGLAPGAVLDRISSCATDFRPELRATGMPGIWAGSENAIAAECLVPRHSKLPGVRRWSEQWQQGVMVNANTVEMIAAQYNSLILERSIVDASARDSRFPQFFPSSELTRRWTNPRTAPTFTYQRITHRRGAKGSA
ncbi:hypothetical protein [Nocardia sp. CA-119907]|uniref:hypothetical protein n=1 Tax=Nocardia sp. CA-119907 TaxID=3239973 RepID=UPI003D99CAA7